MSLKDARSAIASALSLVPDLKPSEKRPDVLVEGSAWPVLARGRPISFGIDEVEWDVIVALPNLNDDGALDMLERIRGPVDKAIASAGFAVTEWRPESLALTEQERVRALRFRVLASSY